MRKGSKKIVISPTKNLERLWKDGFFKKWRTLPATAEHLSGDGYNFPSTALGKALERASYLTKRGKRGGYEYIQKGPYVKE